VSPEQFITLCLSVGIGLLIGTMGSGGSIVILPVLVYIAGIEPYSAVPMSMAVVGTTSLLAAWLQARRGHFHIKAALLLGTTGIVGAYFGSEGTRVVSEQTLMLIFATLLLVVGIVMYRGGVKGLPPGVCRPIRCLSVGAVVGLLSGFLGVGGGFLIVPALVLFAGLETRTAVGTSLAIIALNSAAGLAGQIRYAEFDWTFTLAVTSLTVIGMLGGLAVGDRLPEETLRKAFASTLLIVAIVVGGLNVFVV
jgi:uncharacterized membrane protein YfcA